MSSPFACSEKEQVESTAAYFSPFQGGFSDDVRPVAGQKLSRGLNLGISYQMEILIVV